MDGDAQLKRYDLPVWQMVGAFFYFNHHESDPKLPIDGVAQCRIASEAAGLDIPFSAKADLIKLILNHCCAAKVFGAQELIEFYWDQSVPDSWSSLFVVSDERKKALAQFDASTLNVL